MEKYSIKNFEKLVTDGLEYLRQKGCTGSSIDKYRWTWVQIKDLMIQSSCQKISDGVVLFLKKNYGHLEIKELNHYQKTCMRHAMCLAQFVEGGRMLERIVFIPKIPICLDGEIGDKIQEFLSFKRSQRLNEKTINSYKYYLSEFNKYLIDNKSDKLLALSPLMLLNYVSILLPGELGAKHLAISIIRAFFKVPL